MAQAVADKVAALPDGTMHASGDLIARKTSIGVDVQKRRKGTTTTWKFATKEIGGEPFDQPKYERTTTSYDKAPHLHKTAQVDSVVWTRSSPWSKDSGSVTTVKKQTKDAHGRYSKAVHTYTHQYRPDGASVTTDHIRGTTTTYERERFSMRHRLPRMRTTRLNPSRSALSEFLRSTSLAHNAKLKP